MDILHAEIPFCAVCVSTASLQKMHGKNHLIKCQKLQTQLSLQQNPITYFQLDIAVANGGPKHTQDMVFWVHLSTPKMHSQDWDSLNNWDKNFLNYKKSGDWMRAAQYYKIRVRNNDCSDQFFFCIRTHPHNYHLNRHMFRQSNGSPEMHCQSYQKVKDGNQILAMDCYREQGKQSK